MFCNNHLYKYFPYINFVTLTYIIENPMRMMYKHLNIQQCNKKQIIVNIYCAFVGQTQCNSTQCTVHTARLSTWRSTENRTQKQINQWPNISSFNNVLLLLFNFSVRLRTPMTQTGPPIRGISGGLI